MKKRATRATRRERPSGESLNSTRLRPMVNHRTRLIACAVARRDAPVKRLIEKSLLRATCVGGRCTGRLVPAYGSAS